MTELSVFDLLSSRVPMRPEDVTLIARIIGGQLVQGHDQGIAHGDVGPHTVLVTLADPQQGGVRGARLVGPRPAERPAGWPLAPELAQGPAVPATDVFALGHLLRSLAAGAGPSGTGAGLPLLVSSTIAADPGRRPPVRQLLAALGTGVPAPSTPPRPGPSAPADATTVIGAAAAQPVPPPTPPAPATPAGDAEPAERHRRGPVLVGLVASLVLAVGLGAGYWWVQQRDGTDGPEQAVTERTDLRRDDSALATAETGDLAAVTVGPDGSGQQASDDAAASTGPEPTPSEAAAPSDPATAAPAPASGTTGDDTSSDDAPAPARSTGSTGSTSTGSATVPSPATPSATTPAPPTPSVAPAPPPVLDAGSAEFDAAYCRSRGSLVAMADTESFRAVICDDAGSLSYHGTNRNDGLSIRLPAVEDGSGWTGLGVAGATYEVSSSSIRVLQDDDVLADEPVTTFVDPSDAGTFRPGDLGLTRDISYPACDGAGVVIIDSFVGGADLADRVQDSLDAHPGAEYLRTDLSCDNFNRPAADTTSKQNIYATYYWLGYDYDTVCDGVADVGTYGYWLADDVDPGNTIACG